MPKILYDAHRFRKTGVETVEQVNKILTKYAAQGFKLTLRQVYYQFIAHDLFPDDRTWRWTGSRWVRDPNGTKNSDPNYKWLGDIIDKGRLAGLIDWDMIEDRTRNLKSLPHFDTPHDVMNAAYHSYHLDRWENQTCRVECWIEKDALAGVFDRVCRKWDVPLFSCRGYVSQSEMWRAAMRLKQYSDADQTPFIIHFGDHDPSGIDMTRDIQSRMEMFGCDVAVKRLALNMDQIRQYDPPPNPAKMTDARFLSYMRTYGNESWELDALEPAVLADLVEAAIKNLRDVKCWKEVVEREIEERAVLKTIADAWEDVSDKVRLEMPNRIVKNEDALEANQSYEEEMEE